jgi:hypothetical protein
MVADEEGLKVKDLLESSRVQDPGAASKVKDKGAFLSVALFSVFSFPQRDHQLIVIAFVQQMLPMV